MKKRLLLGIILLAVSAFSAWYYFHETGVEETDQITLYGNVDLRQVNLAFQVSGQIEKMQVSEGAHVKQNQELASIDSTRYQAKLDYAKSSVSALQATLDKLIAGNRPEEIAQAKSRYLAAKTEAQQAQSSYERLKSLLPKKLASQDAVDNAKAKAQALRHQQLATYDAWQVALMGARDEDIAQVKAQIEQAQAQVALAQKDLDDTVLHSPINGIVRDRVLEPGDLAQPQQVVMTLAVQSPKWVRAYVSETELGKIKQGMPAEIMTDSYPGKRYSGWVGYISPVAEFTPKTVQTEELRTQLVYQVRIYTCDLQSELRLGMPATVNIDLQSSPLLSPECDGTTAQNNADS
ncbi:efflux RND transporter periplasmic adaptor subunit [Thiomicrorhabdus xiamenensis]|uniref:Efflux RND transporter periplasmic adaptor subunit n=1 Tax=Thiomicrorhabdus xiamenensis TaxID=2739063 RepID=A0A7D4TFP2_9GAMM|nr:efflux RND transporter periplasmic adaptor subunit [Thiomicrorhabdus xiamenensis]QKI89048.1 efflux RND transporter periplasmic adaptor subunit [Thiomicrorhabdus xiamenensis]